MPYPRRISIPNLLCDRAVVRSGISAVVVISLILVGVICFLCMVGPQTVRVGSDPAGKVRLSDRQVVGQLNRAQR
jgi:hypothetical protein